MVDKDPRMNGLDISEFRKTLQRLSLYFVLAGILAVLLVGGGVLVANR